MPFHRVPIIPKARFRIANQMNLGYDRFLMSYPELSGFYRFAFSFYEKCQNTPLLAVGMNGRNWHFS